MHCNNYSITSSARASSASNISANTPYWTDCKTRNGSISDLNNQSENISAVCPSINAATVVANLKSIS
jgi:hypothetical protein